MTSKMLPNGRGAGQTTGKQPPPTKTLPPPVIELGPTIKGVMEDGQEFSASGITPLPARPDTYALGKRYVPKTERNQETWTRITAALADGPKTLAELTKIVPDHKDFVGYMVRGLHIIPAAAKP